MAYQPVIDGAVMPRAAIEMVAEGASSDVAIMVGSTLDEWKLFAPMDRGHSRPRPRWDSPRVYSRRMTPEAADALISDYEKARASRGASNAPHRTFSALETDRVFRIPAVRLAEVHAKRHGRIHNYLFTWPSPAAGRPARIVSCARARLRVRHQSSAGDAAVRGHWSGRRAPRDRDAGCVAGVRAQRRSELR